MGDKWPSDRLPTAKRTKAEHRAQREANSARHVENKIAKMRAFMEAGKWYRARQVVDDIRATLTKLMGVGVGKGEGDEEPPPTSNRTPGLASEREVC